MAMSVGKYSEAKNPSEIILPSHISYLKYVTPYIDSRLELQSDDVVVDLRKTLTIPYNDMIAPGKRGTCPFLP